MKNNYEARIAELKNRIYRAENEFASMNIEIKKLIEEDKISLDDVIDIFLVSSRMIPEAKSLMEMLTEEANKNIY